MLRQSKNFIGKNSNSIKIIVMGDIHGEWGLANNLIKTIQPEIILQVGDFGWWPSLFHFGGFENENIPIYWCPGNHEQWSDLRKYEKPEPVELMKNIFYMPPMTVLRFLDLNILFIGGANSIDKHRRIAEYSWFADEVIQQKDFKFLPDANEKIDIVISHTAPLEFDMSEEMIVIDNDPSRKALSVILKMFKPKKWFFGHWHVYKTGNNCGCEWTCLNMVDYPNECWAYLNK